MTETSAVKPPSQRKKSAAQIAAELKITEEMKHARRKSWIEFSAFVTLLASTAASVWAVVLVNETSDQTIHFQSEFSGNETWSSYRNLQAEFESDLQGAELVYPSGDSQRDGKYELLNERLLMAADLLTFTNEVQQGWNDPQWEDTFAYEFRENSDFFLNTNFLVGSDNLMSEYCTYRKPARIWLIDAFARSRTSSYELRQTANSDAITISSRTAESMLREAENECNRICTVREGCT